jgi:putative glutamine amidotransferase
MTRKPVVLVPACNRMLGQYASHTVGKKYIDAVRLAGCLPLVVPSLASDELEALLAMADGVLLTGSPSNVHPSHFGESVHDDTLPLDLERDGWTLPLIPRVLERGIPLFAICRGFQEANVALGGSLHQAVHEVPGQHDHRGPDDERAPLDEVFGPAHGISVVPGGQLDAIAGLGPFQVNSAHGQGIKRPAPGLRVEARAPDGLIEAFSVANARGFNLCMQWHPEWRAESDALSRRLFRAFGEACRSFRDRRHLVAQPHQHQE